MPTRNSLDNVIPYGKQTITDEDVAAVVDALRSPLLTTGPKVTQFEERFASVVGAKHAVAVSSGTAALHLALIVAGITPEHRVVTSPNTFLSSANCGAFVDATVDFADVDPVSFTLCPNCLLDTWHNDTRAVVAVHFAGGSADMPKIAHVARERGAVVIEDACHAVGGSIEYQGRYYRIGGHPWSDISTFSFHPVKALTTGEGGMLVTDNDHYARQARLLRSHGINRDSKSFIGLGADELSEQGPWYYEMQDIGYNYRITDFQCALGTSQLGRLDASLSRRREIVATYNESFGGHEVLSTPDLRNPRERDCTSWHLYTLLFDFDAIGMSRTEVMQLLASNGIGTQVHYIPVHLQPWYQRTFGYKAGKCPIAEEYYRHTLSLPLYPSMTDREVDHVIRQVRSIASTSTSVSA